MTTDDSTTTDGDAPNATGGLDAATVDESANDSDDGPATAAIDEDDSESTSRARSVGETAGNALGTGLTQAGIGASRAWDGFLYRLTSALGTDKIWRSRFNKTVKRMYKSTDADAIAFVAGKKGELTPAPAKYRPPTADVDLDDDDDEDPHGYWEVGHFDQTFSAATAEVSTEHINNIPVVFLHTDEWAEASFSGALLAEAVDMGQKDVLYTNPEFNVIELTRELPADGGDGAVADGGTVQSEVKLEQAHPGQLDDSIIDVASPGALDGIRVRWEKFKDLRLDTTTVEEMNQVEQRGYLAGRHDAEDDSGVGEVKWFILGMVALGLGGFWLGAKFGGGGGGGGGGSVMPFTMSLGSTLKSLAFGVGWL